MKRHDTHSIRRVRMALFFVVIILFGGVFVRGIRNSLFFTTKERVNILIYGEHPTYYSIDTKGSLHYAIPYYPDLQLQIPGGYGHYRIGALGKLVRLESRPHLLRNAFSIATSSFVDVYFYPDTDSIYYGDKGTTEVRSPQIGDLLRLQSNASVFDRLYLLTRVFGKHSNAFSDLTNIKAYDKEGDKIFAMKDFIQLYQGYFYQKHYRKEAKNVQVIYSHSSTTAYFVSQLLEGNGIRVSDYTYEATGNEGCQVFENTSTYSESAKTIAAFFNCSLVTGKTGVYDILFILGNREKEWEMEAN
jgi:hypothetical protein